MLKNCKIKATSINTVIQHWLSVSKTNHHPVALEHTCSQKVVKDGGWCLSPHGANSSPQLRSLRDNFQCFPFCSPENPVLAARVIVPGQLQRTFLHIANVIGQSCFIFFINKNFMYWSKTLCDTLYNNPTFSASSPSPHIQKHCPCCLNSLIQFSHPPFGFDPKPIGIIPMASMPTASSC